MRLKILKKFRDKYTGEVYKINDVIEFDEARANEILADQRKLAEKVVEKKPKQNKKFKESEE